MSSSAEVDACSKCGRTPARTPWLFALGWVLLTLGQFGIEPRRVCDRCGPFYTWLGVLMLAVLGIAAAAIVFGVRST